MHCVAPTLTSSPPWFLHEPVHGDFKIPPEPDTSADARSGEYGDCMPIFGSAQAPHDATLMMSPGEGGAGLQQRTRGGRAPMAL